MNIVSELCNSNLAYKGSLVAPFLNTTVNMRSIYLYLHKKLFITDQAHFECLQIIRLCQEYPRIELQQQ